MEWLGPAFDCSAAGGSLAQEVESSDVCVGLLASEASDLLPSDVRFLMLHDRRTVSNHPQFPGLPSQVSVGGHDWVLEVVIPCGASSPLDG